MTPETQAGREPVWEIVRDPEDPGYANFIDGGGFPWRIPVELLNHMDVMEARIRDLEARNAVLEAALKQIGYDDNVSYLACSDLPWCSKHPHADDCAVGIARALLTPDGKEASDAP